MLGVKSGLRSMWEQCLYTWFSQTLAVMCIIYVINWCPQCLTEILCRSNILF